MLLSGNFFGRFDLLLRVALALRRITLATTVSANNIDDRDDDRAAPRVFEQIVRDVVFELGFESVQVDALEALLDGSLELDAQAVHDLFVCRAYI